MKADPLGYSGKGPALTAKEWRKALRSHRTGGEALQQRAASTDKALKRYEGLLHDLIHGPEKKQVMSDLLAWFDAHG